MTPSVSSRRPRVLFVDDIESVTRDPLNVALGPLALDFRLLHPEEVEETDLAWADMVIVDYFLEDWPERDEVDSVARSPRDGLAIVSTMRSVALPSRTERDLTSPNERPVAFAVWSANVELATFGLPANILPHVFARENGLEWIFRRNDLLTPAGLQQVLAIAVAVRSLAGKTWGSSQSQLNLFDLLALDSRVAWFDEAETSVLDCRPPINDLAASTVGMSVIRWMLHRILPYPCFLLDEADLRARLRIAASDRASSTLFGALEGFRYRGILSEFDGPRWWRSGVEAWLWSETDGRPSDSRALAVLAAKLDEFPVSGAVPLVRVIDADLSRSRQLYDMQNVVRVRPDDWPPYADDAYATIPDASADPQLRRLVDPDDRELLLQSPS